jgi:hypothetical protein
LNNVQLLGERPYGELPGHLARFDVTIIPFKLLDLIVCTNPVKLYEYMAAGKPVVASAMPEVVAATDLIYIAGEQEDFVRQIERALIEDSPDLRGQRISWAQDHGWNLRAEAFRDAVARMPKVSVIVLSYNGWAYTEATLWSLITFSDYENLEIIVVDNASSDQTVEELRAFRQRDSRIKVIQNDENLGYAGGKQRRSSRGYGRLLDPPQQRCVCDSRMGSGSY